MTDTPSFRDTIEEVASQEAKTPQESQPSTQEQPVKTEEQPQTEVFADKGELSGKTPEQLEEIYQNWQRAYTEKRQKETQELKDLKQKLAQLEVQPQQSTQDTQQLAQDAQNELQLGNMTVAQYTEYMRQLAIQDAKEVARNEYQEMISAQKEETLANNALAQFQSADNRLNEHSPEYKEGFKQEVQRELADLLDEHLEQFGTYEGFDAASITKQIVERRDKELDEVIKQRTQQSTQAAKMREAKARKSEVRGSTSDGQSIGGDSIRNILSETIDSNG